MSNDHSMQVPTHSGPLSRPASTPVSKGAERSAPPRPGDAPAERNAPPTPEPVPLSTKELSETVEHLNDLVRHIGRELRFSVDEESGRTVINVLDAETEEIIRRIPPEEAVSVAMDFEGIKGGLVRGKA